MTFNKNFIIPNITNARKLQDAGVDQDPAVAEDATVAEDTAVDQDAVVVKEAIHAEDFISLTVRDQDDDDKDKSIIDFTIASAIDNKLVLNVEFSTPEDVSDDLKEPDFLDV